MIAPSASHLKRTMAAGLEDPDFTPSAGCGSVSQLPDAVVCAVVSAGCVSGRVVHRRKRSKKLAFFDLIDASSGIRVCVIAKSEIAGGPTACGLRGAASNRVTMESVLESLRRPSRVRWNDRSNKSGT